MSSLIASAAAAYNARPDGLLIADAVTHVAVDTPAVSIVNRTADASTLAALIQRTDYVGRLLATPPLLADVARRSGVPEDRIGGIVRMTGNVPLALTEPDSQKRAADIAESYLPYRLELQSRPTTPILDIYTQAPSEDAARDMADNAVVAAQAWMRATAAKEGVAADRIPRLRQLGPARATVINRKAPIVIGAVTFMTVFALVAGALLLLLRLGGSSAIRGAVSPPQQDDWPHTTRVVPWMLAAFIAVVYVVPFSAIELNMSLPIDLKFDRLILPLVVIPWVLALAAGGVAAPRLRLTRIHVAVAVFVGLAFLSVTLDARYLNSTQELMLSLKKLPLLLSYVSLFLIASSGVRRSEVGALLNFMLALAVVCGLGMIVEFRFETNLFYAWADKLLPGLFTVTGVLPGGAVDELGRRLVRGPAEVSLEAVTMLALALPIAFVGLLHARRWRQRLLYGFAAAALFAAMVATYRKSGLLAPVSIILTLAYFRRRELLKLAPFGMVLVVLISALSPGAMGSVVSQFTRADRSKVSTVSDRAADYDAVRPDLFSHFAFGRGWGSYNHESYRILDSEILHRVLEMGVLGLIAFFMLSISVVLATRHVIGSRHPRWSPPALVCAAAAVAFLVVATLYDVLSFPHGTYAFLFLAGVASVVADRGPERVEAATESAGSGTRPLRHRGGSPRTGGTSRRGADRARA